MLRASHPQVGRAETLVVMMTSLAAMRCRRRSDTYYLKDHYGATVSSSGRHASALTRCGT